MIGKFVNQYILVKAPLRVLYNKIQHEGWGRVANTARGEYGAFTDLLVLRGRISKYFCSHGSGAMLLGRLVL